MYLHWPQFRQYSKDKVMEEQLESAFPLEEEKQNEKLIKYIIQAKKLLDSRLKVYAIPLLHYHDCHIV